MAPFRLVCLENPLLDIQAYADDKILGKYGLKADDAILAEDKHKPIYEELLADYKAVMVPGGAAQNTARGAQYLLPPDSVLFLGCVGDDKYAERLHEGNDKVGLSVAYRVDAQHPTGRCAVLISGDHNQNRSMVTDLGAANHYTLEHLKSPEVWSKVEGAEAFYIGGYHFTVCPPAIMELAKLAAEKDKIFALSISAPFIPMFFKEPLDAAVPYVDYLIGNSDEARAFAEAHAFGTTDLHEVIRKMANLPKENGRRKRVVIVTQGMNPTLVGTQGEDEVKQYPVHVIAKDKINDATGAGDAFAGGLCAGIIQGKSLDESVDMGQWLASLTLKGIGASYPLPKQAYPGKS